MKPGQDDPKISCPLVMQIIWIQLGICFDTRRASLLLRREHLCTLLL